VRSGKLPLHQRVGWDRMRMKSCTCDVSLKLEGKPATLILSTFPAFLAGCNLNHDQSGNNHHFYFMNTCRCQGNLSTP
jgi:hypothetical protein